MKYLTLLLLSIPFPSFSQTEASFDEKPNSSWSIGVFGTHMLGKTSQQSYQTCSLPYCDKTDNSFSQLYSANAGYNFKKSFVRLSAGVMVDFVKVQLLDEYFVQDNLYYSQSKTTLKDRNHSLFLGTKVGTFFTSGKVFNIGGALGFDFISRHHNTVLQNEVFIRTNSSSGGSSSETFTYDNQSNFWKNNVDRVNSVLFSPNLHLILSFRLSNQLSIELQGSARFSYRVGAKEEPESQFPVSVGLQYTIF
jgi:hypothetical protein